MIFLISLRVTEGMAIIISFTLFSFTIDGISWRLPSIRTPPIRRLNLDSSSSMKPITLRDRL